MQRDFDGKYLPQDENLLKEDEEEEDDEEEQENQA